MQPMQQGSSGGEAGASDTTESPSGAAEPTLALLPSSSNDKIGRLRLPIAMLGIAVLGITVFSVCLAEIFGLPNPSLTVLTLTAIGILTAIISALLLLLGSQKRSQLIYNLHRDVLDLAAQVEAQDRRWNVDDNGEWLAPVVKREEADAQSKTLKEGEEFTRNQLLDLVHDYELSLARLSAFTEATEARMLEEHLRYRYAGRLDF
jgi:hypothetical protein